VPSTSSHANGVGELDTPLTRDSTAPSLDTLAAAPSPSEALSRLSPDALAALSGQCATIQSAIQLAIITRTVTPARPPAPASDGATRLLDASTIAQRTGLARSYVYELIRSGSLRAVKVGKYRRVTESALAEWIVRHEAQAR
jgi:excisionase family DNA binding protein